MKYQQSKIYRVGSQVTSPFWMVVTTFAGNTLLMEALESRLERDLNDCKPFPKVLDVEGCLKDAFPELHQNLLQGEDELEILCGVTNEDEHPQLIYGSRTAVFSTNNVRYIGIGDSSLIRFLESKLYRPEMDANEAALVGVYMVAQAKEFIEGVGGDTNAAILRPGGWAEFYGPSDTVDTEQRWGMLEYAGCKILRKFLDMEVCSDEDFSKAAQKELKDLIWTRRAFFSPFINPE